MVKKLKFKYQERRDFFKDIDVVIKSDGNIITVINGSNSYQLSEQLSKQILETIDDCHVEEWETTYYSDKDVVVNDGYGFEVIYVTEKASNITVGSNNCPTTFEKLKKAVEMCIKDHRKLNSKYDCIMYPSYININFKYHSYCSHFDFNCELIDDCYHINYEIYDSIHRINKKEEIILDEEKTSDLMSKIINSGIIDMHVKREQKIIYDVPEWSLQVEVAGKKKSYQNRQRFYREIQCFVNVLDEIIPKCSMVVKQEETFDTPPFEVWLNIKKEEFAKERH